MAPAEHTDAAEDDAAPAAPIPLTIDDVGSRGDGVARAPGVAGPVFIPYALPGEEVVAVIAGERGRLEAVTTPSPDRVEPACRHFGECGACALQHWAPEAYRAWKRRRVVRALEKAGVAADVAPVLAAAASGRRRAGWHAVRSRAVGFRFGYTRAASHWVFDIAECPVLAPPLEAALPALRTLAETLLARAGRVTLHATATDVGLDVVADGPPAPADAALTAAARAADAGDWARVTWRGDVLVHRRAPVIALDGVPVEPPAGGFLQATADGEAALRRMVVEAAAGARRAVELYAGIGTFTFALARTATVNAYEGDRAALAALKTAAQKAGRRPIHPMRRDLAKAPVTAREMSRADLVVLDPPRGGAGGQITEIAESGVARVVYVSCDPAAFARDAAVLVQAGFALETVRPVDQFLYAPHVELTGVFTR